MGRKPNDPIELWGGNTEKNGDAESHQNANVVFRPPWIWGSWRQWKMRRFILVYEQALEELYWSIAGVSDFFTWRPPW